MTRSTQHPWLNRFAWLTAAATFVLLGVGGLVTSHGAGMAVPDWPTSYGYNMFLFPVRFWTGGVFYEHTHRLFASWVGLLTTILAVWLWFGESRPVLRWLGVAAFFAVIFQGVLGGLRVTLLKDQIGIVHAALGQSFFVLVTLLALFASPYGNRAVLSLRHLATSSRTRWLTVLTTVLIFAQLVLGATMRHQHAGLAVPDFPTAYGQLWPPTNPAFLEQINQRRTDVRDFKPITAFQIVLHMTHRIMAAAILLLVAGLTWASRRAPRPERSVMFCWLGLIAVQALLGAATVWSNKAADVATAHVLLGALSLLNGAFLAVSSLRARVEVRSKLAEEQVPFLSDASLEGQAESIPSMMKATVVASLPAPALEKSSLLTAFLDLTKFRLTSLVLITTAVGFYIGARGVIDYVLFLNTILGTALVASGAAALNQLLEKDYDALMNRTRTRPLPCGRLQPEAALAFGVGAASAGMLYLAFTVNVLTAFLSAVTLISYVFVYTPLKRVTSLNTVVGAIPGALPPLMGWTGARGEISVEGWSLFAILFFWQLPHFLAISWLYREEYKRAGFVMLSVLDPDGQRTGRQAVCHTLGLLPVSLCPFLFGLSGPLYCLGAFTLGSAFLWFAIQFSRTLTLTGARKLFYVSILYLPVLLGLMVFDKVR